MKHARSSRTAHPQQAKGHTHGLRASGELGIPQSPYLTLAEGARFWRFDATAVNPKEAFRRWLHRNAVPIRRRGKTLLVEKRLVEAVLDRDGSDRLSAVR